MAPNPFRRLQTRRIADGSDAAVRITSVGNRAVLQDELFAVNIVDKQIERRDPLFEALFDHAAIPIRR